MVDLFVYVHAPSAIHKLDARVKILLSMMIVMAAAQASITGTIIITIMIVGCFRVGAIPAVPFLRGLRRILPVFMILFFGTLFSRQPDSAGKALHAVYRFILMIASSHVLVSVTPLTGIRYAIEYFLRPVPFIPERKTSRMLELMIGFFPLIFRKMEDAREARLARCSSIRKNFIKTSRDAVLHLLEVVSILSNEVSDAMEARCFSVNVPSPSLPHLRILDICAGIALGLPLVVIIFSGM